MHNVTLPIRFGASPVLSRHSTTAPLMVEVAVATAVEFNKRPNIISVTSWKVNWPQGLVVMGGLWSMIASLQLSGTVKEWR